MSRRSVDRLRQAVALIGFAEVVEIMRSNYYRKPSLAEE
jgi:hypothetical protein